MSSSVDNLKVTKAFTENAYDSIQHAFDYFIELSQGGTSKWHHQKWIIVSTHHAASCLVCAWLKEADPSNKCFKNREGGESFPYLENSIKALIKYKNTKHLTIAEADLLCLFGRLNSIRNNIVHRIPPTEFNREVIAFAAMSIVGIFHTVSRRCGLSFEELFNEYPENRKSIVEALHYSKVEEYCRFIERVLEDKYPLYLRSMCPSCGTLSVVGGGAKYALMK